MVVCAGEPPNLSGTGSVQQLNRIKAMNSVGQYDPTSGTPFAGSISSLKTRYSYDANGNISHLSRTAWKAGETNPVLMDNLTYHYQPGTNRLQYVTDPVDKDAFKEDIDNQPAGNYAYDAIGNLTSDEQEGIEEISWNVYGKIAGIKYSIGKNKDDLAFLYDATGQRVAKIVKKKDTNGEYDPQLYTSTWYIRDAQGNVLYTEVWKPEEAGIKVTDKEYPVYGSSRLGMYHEQETDPAAPGSVNDFERRVGSREYELTSHLGNVLATVSDYKVYDQGDDVYYASVLTAQDYYPFGMVIPGRSYKPVSCEEVETEGAGAVQHMEGFEELTTSATPWTEGSYSGEVINGWDSRIGQYLLSGMPLGEISWEEVGGNGKLKCTEGQAINGSYLVVAARTYTVTPSTKYRLTLDISSASGFITSLGVVDKDLLETNPDIETIAHLVSDQTDTSGPVELEFTTTTETAVIFFAASFTEAATDVLWLDNVKLATVTDDEPPVITVQVNDTFGTGITPWRNTMLEDGEKITVVLGSLSYEDTGERVRVDLVANNDEEDLRMTGAMLKLFTMQPGKKYLLSYDSKDMNNLSPAMQVLLFGRDVLEEGIEIVPAADYTVTAVSGRYEVELTAPSEEVYIVILQEHEGDNDPYHYYVDNITLQEGWVVNNVCDDPNDPGIAKSRYRYGFNGQEKESELNESITSAEYWMYDGRLGRRWNVDPRPNVSISNYACFNNNAIWFVDILGDTAYQFRPDGSFFQKIDDGKNEVIGQFFQKSTPNYDKDGKLLSYTYSDPVNFTFNDLELDREDLVSGIMKVILITENDIDIAMNFNGVKTPEAQENPWVYIERESRPIGNESIFSGESSGLLDHYSTSPIVERGYLHVVKPASGQGLGVGYNDMDFGNFLWGHAGKMLGFSILTLRTAAHINNAVNGRSDNPDKEIPLLDSDSDQRAIQGGHNYPIK